MKLISILTSLPLSRLVAFKKETINNTHSIISQYDYHTLGLLLIIMTSIDLLILQSQSYLLMNFPICKNDQYNYVLNLQKNVIYAYYISILTD